MIIGTSLLTLFINAFRKSSFIGFHLIMLFNLKRIFIYFMIKYLSNKLLNNIINKLLELFNLDFKSYNLFKFIYFFKLRISYAIYKSTF